MSSKILELHQPCPSCSSSDAYCRYDDGHGYCFSCGTYFPPLNYDRAMEFTYEYLPWRGVTAETMRFYNVKTKIDASGKPVSISYPYPSGGSKVRSVVSKDFWSDGQPLGLFGADRFDLGSSKAVTITEGELDALSLYQAIRTPVVSVRSATSGLGDCIRDLAFLNSFDHVYLAFDSDAAGRDLEKAVARLFDFNRVFQVKFVARKDANEYVQAGEEDILRNLWWNSKRYLPENVVSSFQDFKEILEESPPKAIPYPFKTLTDLTYGIRTGESVLITGLEGIGKTELMHFIEYQLLQETDSNVGAIFLEEPKQRHLQALAGIKLRSPVHLPGSTFTSSDILSAVEEVVGKDDRLHIYSHFGANDPEILLDTIRFLVSACGCRYILLDHLTMCVSGLAGEDERRALDYLSTRLEMMVKELGYALILVSHINDFGQTRGSRYISKIADIRIDARRDIEAGSNRTFLTVSKNRFSGKTGAAGSLDFDPLTYSYKEVA